MGPEHHHHDQAVDTVLAALRDAAPPEGMEARLHQRLAQAAALPQSSSRLQNIFAGSTLAGAWARGALTGAAFALLAVAAVLLLQHGARPNPAHPQLTANNIASLKIAPAAPASTSSNSRSRSAPCVTPHLLPAQSPVSAPSNRYRPASFAPSRPAPELPLTADERALVRLTQTADPRLLAALAPETQAKLDAQETDNFNKFFAPPPAPPQPADSASPTTPDQSLTPTKAGETL
jgi:hypothetical protein